MQYSLDLPKQNPIFEKQYIVNHDVVLNHLMENNTVLDKITNSQIQTDTNNHRCSGRDLNPGSATRKATMLDRIVQLELINYYTTGATVK